MQSQIAQNAMQDNSLATAAFKQVNGVDLLYNYKYDKEGPRNTSSIVFTPLDNGRNSKSIEQMRADANINRICFWLTLKQGEKGRGDTSNTGILYNVLGKSSDPSQIASHEKSIKQAINAAFEQDLELLMFKIVPDLQQRSFIINMIVKDKVSQEATSASLKATL